MGPSEGITLPLSEEEMLEFDKKVKRKVVELHKLLMKIAYYSITREYPEEIGKDLFKLKLNMPEKLAFAFVLQQLVLNAIELLTEVNNIFFDTMIPLAIERKEIAG